MAESLVMPVRTDLEDDDLIRLDPGTALAPAEMAAVMTHWQTRVVILVGEAGSGKRSLITALYGAFLEGSLPGYDFGGSQTIRGLEALLAQPQPERFVHLLVREQDSRATKRSLLVATMASERFDAIIDQRARLSDMPALRRADRVALVVDGERLASPKDRHSTVTKLRLMMRTCLESGEVGPSRIQIVITKWDQLYSAALLPAAVRVEAELRELVRSHGEAPMVFHTAARGQDPALAPRLGLPELLASWVLPTTRRPPRIVAVHSPRLFDQVGAEGK